MKIALVAPIEETVPPTKYGGTEWIVYALAHGVGQKGHNVDLYAAGDSPKDPSYTLRPSVETHLRATLEYSTNAAMRETEKLYRISQTIQQLAKEKYDIIHNHVGWRFLIFSGILQAPIVTTHHGPLSLPYQNLIYERFRNYPYVSISNNQRKDLPSLNFIQNIYNGIDQSVFAFKDMPDFKNDYMLFIARLSPEKGPLEAVATAIATKKNLVITSKIDLVDKKFYEEQFKPQIDSPFIHFLGEIGQAKKLSLYQNAILLLAPIQWEEPFGLMFTESMSCGTPVVAYSRGSAPEIIEDGVTGFLVNESDTYIRGNFIIKKTGIEGLKEAVERIYAMSPEDYRQMRKNARERVEKHFTVEKMVDEYEKVYEKILSEK